MQASVLQDVMRDSCSTAAAIFAAVQVLPMQSVNNCCQNNRVAVRVHGQGLVRLLYRHAFLLCCFCSSKKQYGALNPASAVVAVQVWVGWEAWANSGETDLFPGKMSDMTFSLNS